jgi:hypothetical protein
LAGAAAGLLLTTVVLADAVPSRRTSSGGSDATATAEAEASGAGLSATGLDGSTAAGAQAASPCPDAEVPVRLSDFTIDELTAGRPQLISVVLRVDDLIALALDEGAVADGAGMVTLDPSVQELYQDEVDVRAATMLLVADLPSDRLRERPVIAPVVALVPDSAAAPERPALQLFATAGLLVRQLDEVCRTADSIDVSAIGSLQEAAEDAGFGVPSTVLAGGTAAASEPAT